eukprot:TRINITY_DN20339_c0_g1_i3.p1 TRINITY_DN20339_c0_g1~~TRINITY_DN20339_c0_g1_i3.p1  ORF type:complete len:354 (-),score=83.71 TRINITY_DN20339_c0_g1_i3:222-1283(-)
MCIRDRYQRRVRGSEIGMEAQEPSVPVGADAEGHAEDTVVIKAHWGKKKYLLQMAPGNTVQDVREMLFSLTDVPPQEQKLVGLKRGRAPATDSDTVSSLDKMKKFMMIGNAEEIPDVCQGDIPQLINDLDYEPSTEGGSSDRNMWNAPATSKLEERVQSCEVNIMHPLREGKKLLVLDLDYTMFDCKGNPSRPISELKRPYTNQFLSALWQSYDIVIWSQTSWRWLEAKITELGFLDPTNDFKISFVLDKTSMFSIQSPRGKHEVKPLEFIWRRFPQYNQKNTLHVDDLGRNFAMNPQNGVKVSAWKTKHPGAVNDQELLMLMHYLNEAAKVEDVSALDHRDWLSHPNEVVPR